MKIKDYINKWVGGGLLVIAPLSFSLYFKGCSYGVSSNGDDTINTSNQVNGEKEKPSADATGSKKDFDNAEEAEWEDITPKQLEDKSQKIFRLPPAS